MGMELVDGMISLEVVIAAEGEKVSIDVRKCRVS